MFVLFSHAGHDGVPKSEGHEEGPLMLDFMHPTWQHVKYCIYQREICPKTGRIHLQGYIEFTQQKTYAAIHELEGLQHARFERRMGSAKQAKHYCQKPVEGCDCNSCRKEAEQPTKLEGPWEFGEMSQQGQRADLLEIKRRIDKGDSLKRIAQDPETFPTWIKFPRGFHEYKHMEISIQVRLWPVRLVASQRLLKLALVLFVVNEKFITIGVINLLHLIVIDGAGHGSLRSHCSIATDQGWSWFMLRLLFFFVFDANTRVLITLYTRITHLNYPPQNTFSLEWHA